MKSSIRTYCCESHDILTACDMRDALQQHPVKGTSASVNVVDESHQDLEMKKLEHFSSFHNFHFEDSGVRAWKAYGIGEGKHFSYSTIYVNHQGPTMLQTQEDFFEPIKEREMKTKQSLPTTTETTEKETEEKPLFEYQVPGCNQAFKTFADM